MNARLRFLAGVGSAVVVGLGGIVPAGAVAPAPSHQKPTSSAGTVAADCFWFGPTPGLDTPANNYAFPDSQADYYAAVFSLPEGSKLTFDHEFAHARYQSLNSYNATTNQPSDALNDVSTVPDPGSHNPYLPGAKRSKTKHWWWGAKTKHRSYTATLVDEAPPTDPSKRATNTLYAGVDGQPKITLLYRLYTPDRRADTFGDVGLPRPSLKLADGTTVTGAAVCDTVQAEQRTTLPLTLVPRATYDALRNQPGKPEGFPAEPTPRWQTFYNVKQSLACIFQDACSEGAVKTGGQYSNKDNQYVSTQGSRVFGEVLVLQGKLPVTPKTFKGQTRMARHVDMRYWSLCSGESYATTASVDCMYDEEVVTDRHRRYTIVVSLPKDRPANATRAKGVTWLSMSPQGDGAGNPDDFALILRNMLPSPNFSQAVHNTRVPGDEKAVMGAYLPDSVYTSRKVFEALWRR